LEGRPTSGTTNSLVDIEETLLGIEILVESGEYTRADDLYKDRLENGRIFSRLPAAHEGLQTALNFVATEERRSRCSVQLSRERLAFYFNEVGLFSAKAGEMRLAVQYYRDAADINRVDQRQTDLGVNLQNLSALLASLGMLTDSESAADEAYSLAQNRENKTEALKSLVCKGRVLTLQGKVKAAMVTFIDAAEINQSLMQPGPSLAQPGQSLAQHGQLYGIQGVWWADLMIRAGLVAEARRLTIANLKHSKEGMSFHHVALCSWMLGRIAIQEKLYGPAEQDLNSAEYKMRHGHMIEDLIHVLIAQSTLFIARNRAEQAIQSSDEAVRLAEPREMRTLVADCYVSRGRAWLEYLRAHPSGASNELRIRHLSVLEDAERGLRLARRCHYPWAELDALELMADGYDIVGDSNQERSFRRQSRIVAESLALS